MMTPFTLTSLQDLHNLAFDTIIDVRSPSEFDEDHVPGAVNLPVLDDTQRAEVGTLYTRISPFNARRVGGALVARNTARHLQGPLADKAGGWQPLVYCWRGGQRSGAFATILDQIGWRVRVLQGGYQSYRRQIVQTLYDTPLSHKLMLIDGGTGTAKTALLAHLESQGAQTLDLEGLAGHRGSLFGRTQTPQPPQKLFESRLADRLGRLDPTRLTFVEAESSKIGDRLIPPSLWSAMTAAPRLQVQAPLAARSAFLCHAYDDLTLDAGQLSHLIDQLRPYHATELIEEWHALARAHAFEPLAGGLVARHYDPRYAKSAARRGDPVVTFDLPDLDPSTLRQTATDILTRFAAA